MLDGTEHYVCQCGADEHTLRFTLDVDSGDPCIYTSIYLNDWRPWWKRAWIGIKYIFGYSCQYGHWDCWMMCYQDAERLRSMLDRYLEMKENTRVTEEMEI